MIVNLFMFEAVLRRPTFLRVIVGRRVHLLIASGIRRITVIARSIVTFSPGDHHYIPQRAARKFSLHDATDRGISR